MGNLGTPSSELHDVDAMLSDNGFQGNSGVDRGGGRHAHRKYKIAPGGHLADRLIAFSMRFGADRYINVMQEGGA